MEEKTNKYISLLKTKLLQIDDLEKDPIEEKVSQWKHEVLIILDKAIGLESKHYKEFDELDFQSKNQIILHDDDFEGDRRKGCQQDLKEAKAIINAIIYGIENGLL